MNPEIGYVFYIGVVWESILIIIPISGVDDVKEFRSTQEAFKLLGFTAKEQGNIYKILAGILQVNLFKNPLFQ